MGYGRFATENCRSKESKAERPWPPPGRSRQPSSTWKTEYCQCKRRAPTRVLSTDFPEDQPCTSTAPVFKRYEPPTKETSLLPREEEKRVRREQRRVRWRTVLTAFVDTLIAELSDSIATATPSTRLLGGRGGGCGGCGICEECRSKSCPILRIYSVNNFSVTAICPVTGSVTLPAGGVKAKVHTRGTALVIFMAAIATASGLTTGTDSFVVFYDILRDGATITGGNRAVIALRNVNLAESVGPTLQLPTFVINDSTVCPGCHTYNVVITNITSVPINVLYFTFTVIA